MSVFPRRKARADVHDVEALDLVQWREDVLADREVGVDHELWALGDDTTAGEGRGEGYAHGRQRGAESEEARERRSEHLES